MVTRVRRLLAGPGAPYDTLVQGYDLSVRTRHIHRKDGRSFFECDAGQGERYEGGRLRAVEVVGERVGTHLGGARGSYGVRLRCEEHCMGYGVIALEEAGPSGRDGLWVV